MKKNLVKNWPVVATSILVCMGIVKIVCEKTLLTKNDVALTYEGRCQEGVRACQEQQEAEHRRGGEGHHDALVCEESSKEGRVVCEKVVIKLKAEQDRLAREEKARQKHLAQEKVEAHLKAAQERSVEEQLVREMPEGGKSLERLNATCAKEQEGQKQVVECKTELKGVQLWEDGPYWAECNVGAMKPEESGCFFWWGDTVGYKREGDNWNAVDGSRRNFSFDDKNCPTVGKSKAELLSMGYIDASGNLTAAHDAAAVHLGVPWRLPTDTEWAALIENCTSTWTMLNGVYGRLMAGKGRYSSKHVFLPAAGSGDGVGVFNLGTGCYWSSTSKFGVSLRNCACNVFFSSGYFAQEDFCPRRSGLFVRPVRDSDNNVAIRQSAKRKPQTPGICTTMGQRGHVGDTKTITLPGGATMEMVWCPPGSFTMGSSASEQGRRDNEVQHSVTLTKGFWLGKYEVTQRQWESVMGTNPSRFQSPDRPVERVSWEDCQAFIRAVRRANPELVVRLPTEAEWEYACRAGTEGAYSGNGVLDDMGWYYDNSQRETHIVGQKQANAWGFYDMHGNVREWCSDFFGLYSSRSTQDPVGPTVGAFRVFRGGSWIAFARFCRSAYRDGNQPSSRNGYLGFRLCCSAGPRE